MEISKDKVVSLSYELRIDNEQGELVEKVEASEPLTFLFGQGMMLPAFERELQGLSKGDKADFKLTADEAYGEVEDNAIVDLPKQIFEVDGKIDEEMLVVGNVVPMQDNSGNRLNGRVLEIGDDVVKMDFNHPLAGENLFFQTVVVEVREATEEELQHNHAHNCDDGSCGCGDSSCN